MAYAWVYHMDWVALAFDPKEGHERGCDQHKNHDESS